MAYAYVTFAQAKTQLANRLYDPNSKFWTDAEKGIYIKQALQTWNSLANFWRDEFTVPVVQGTTWYNIADTAVAPATLRAYTVTDQNLVNLIQYHFLEPLSGTYPLTWTGSTQFSIDDILKAIQRRRDEVLSLTGCNITRSSVAASTVTKVTSLSDSIVDLRRVAWLPNTNSSGYTNTPLLPDDEWGLQAFETDYITHAAGTPSTYRQSAQLPLTFSVDILPANAGNYELLTVNTAGDLSTASSSLLYVPDDFTWVIVFGAMADLLSRESNAKDLMRAQYCETRYKQGLAVMLSGSAVLYSKYSTDALLIDSVQNVDNFRPSWQSETEARPDTLLTAGLNLIGFAARPNTGYTVTLGVVENAPLPSADGNNLQVSQDNLEAVLDYAQHLASFKMGGLEFQSTIPLLERFHRRAAQYNNKLNELGEFTKPMYEASQLQAESDPVFETNPTAEE